MHSKWGFTPKYQENPKIFSKRDDIVQKPCRFYYSTCINPTNGRSSLCSVHLNFKHRYGKIIDIFIERELFSVQAWGMRKMSWTMVSGLIPQNPNSSYNWFSYSSLYMYCNFGPAARPEYLHSISQPLGSGTPRGVSTPGYSPGYFRGNTLGYPVLNGLNID